MTNILKKEILIDADAEAIWLHLTQPELMKKWIGEPQMNIEIETNWRVGSPIIISGFHHVKFKNEGIILQYEPNKLLKYTHLDSVSRLPDIPENQTILEFILSPFKDGTQLSLTITNFPTVTIFKHLEFYWRGTLEIFKRVVENQQEQVLE
ncbi:MAG TPA: SRPBCC domain-containing protein [Patescibacteria group bacterium]|nr:SRPBCC domain-containing protein [Patescibacteria group bacterium]